MVAGENVELSKNGRMGLEHQEGQIIAIVFTEPNGEIRGHYTITPRDNYDDPVVIEGLDANFLMFLRDAIRDESSC